MNKKIRKILPLFIAFIFILGSVKIDVKAAGGLSISANASTVSEGETFTVTVKAAGNYFVSNVSLNVSGGTLVSGLGVTSLDKGESAKAKIKLTAEKCVVTVTGVGANYDTETEEAAKASVSVKKKVVVVDTRSKDNTLSSISVSEGTLSPTFDASTTEYNVAVSGATEKIVLNATARDAKATVSGTGEKTVAPGHNKFTIVCTAENGAKKEYIVDVYVDETPTVFATYGEQNLGVVRNQTEIQIPTSFEPTTVLLGEQEVQAYHSNQLNMTLLYMQNEAGEKNFYMYEEEKGIVSIFKPVTILGKNVILFDLTEEEKIRENMVYSEVTVDGMTMYGWTYENPDFSNYIHILVMNELGEKIVYQYETTENTLQLYREYIELEEEVKTFSFGVFTFEVDEFYLLCGLVGLCVALIVTIVIMAIKRKEKEPVGKRRYKKKLKKLEKKQKS